MHHAARFAFLCACLVSLSCAPTLSPLSAPAAPGAQAAIAAVAYLPTPLAPGGLVDDLWLGSATPADILSLGPRWKRQHDGYTPSAQIVAELRRTLRWHAGLHLDIVFGSWCRDSVREVPRFLKLVEALGDAAPPLRFIGVDREKRDPTGLGLLHAARKVPTFVVLQRNREVGRVIERPRVSLEADLLAIVLALPPR